MEKKKEKQYRRVLIVDDNPTVVTVIATRLMAMGWDCMTALDGHDAMHLLNQHKADVVVTDLDMPYIDGFSILELAESFITRPAIAITGSLESAMRCKQDFPDVPLLMKPFDGKELVDLINKKYEMRPNSAA